jgi:hypothetical protein
MNRRFCGCCADRQPIQAAQSKTKKPKEKTEKEVQAEIREIMKQITASVTFLPMLEEPCTSSCFNSFQIERG